MLDFFCFKDLLRVLLFVFILFCIYFNGWFYLLYFSLLLFRFYGFCRGFSIVFFMLFYVWFYGFKVAPSDSDGAYGFFMYIFFFLQMYSLIHT